MRQSIKLMSAHRIASLLALTVLGAACSAPPSEAPASSAPATPTATPSPLGTASIAGRVTFGGSVPAPVRINLAGEPKCAAQRPEGLLRESVRVKDGGLADTVVYVKSGLDGPFATPPAPAVLDQVTCEYTPSVVAVMAGQSVLVRNSDDVVHNVHFRPAVNRESNKSQPRKGMEQTLTFDTPELLFPVGCDIHPWMRAFVAVLPNPYFAVSAADGSFEIKGLPAGTFELEAAHPRLKTKSTSVTVKDGEAAQTTLAFP